MRDLVLVGPVIVHRPDFLVPAAIADEINLRFGNPLNPSTQAENDLVSKLVRHDPSCRFTGRVRVLLAENLWRLGVLYVEEPALSGQFAVRHSEIAESQHPGVRRWRAPGKEVHFRRLPWHLQWIEALRDQFNYAGNIQIVPERVVESLQ